MFLDEKTVLEIWLNPGLNFTIVRGTGPWRTLEGSSSQASFYMGKNLTPLPEPKALAHTLGASRCRQWASQSVYTYMEVGSDRRVNLPSQKRYLPLAEPTFVSHVKGSPRLVRKCVLTLSG